MGTHGILETSLEGGVSGDTAAVLPRSGRELLLFSTPRHPHRLSLAQWAANPLRLRLTRPLMRPGRRKATDSSPLRCTAVHLSTASANLSRRDYTTLEETGLLPSSDYDRTTEVRANTQVRLGSEFEDSDWTWRAPTETPRFDWNSNFSVQV